MLERGGSWGPCALLTTPPCWRQASLDQPTQTVAMHRTEPTAQQTLALQLAEKLGALVENNERVLDHKQGSYGGGYFRGERPRPVGGAGVGSADPRGGCRGGCPR